jgi:hypothetical protein
MTGPQHIFLLAGRFGALSIIGGGNNGQGVLCC